VRRSRATTKVPPSVGTKTGLILDDSSGKYAFQRLRQTWFSPKIDPKFKLQSDDKVYAIGSCFARGLEYSLIRRKIAVESAAPEFVRLQPVNKEVSGLGFINKYNTFSILNELRWALDPDAVFPVESIAQVTETTWSDPHANPTLELAGFEETLARRSLLQTVTRQAVIFVQGEKKRPQRARNASQRVSSGDTNRPRKCGGCSGA
jgi:hypothetical protein